MSEGGLWLLPSVEEVKKKKKSHKKGNKQKGGSIRPTYDRGGERWRDFGSDIMGLVTYIPASIEVGVKAIWSTAKLPGEIASTLVNENPPNPNEIKLEGL
jgi:hypothetical protein